MKFTKTLVKCLCGAAVTAWLSGCAVVPAGGVYGGGYGTYGHAQVQGQVYASPASVYVAPPAVVVRPAPFYFGRGWGWHGGHGHHGGRH